jgi:alpha-glucosidase
MKLQYNLTALALGLSAVFAAGQSAAVPASPTTEQLELAAKPSSDSTWWKHAVIYEIYPRSFQDSNGDGIGDLNGIRQRLDYLKKLGVDAIWITPMFPSPQVDFGYDVSDFRAVDPQYGTLADMDRLIAEAKKRNIRICLDWVVNHTSDKHQWFIESSSSRNNPKSDWYIWNDGKSIDDPSTTAYERRFAHEGRVPINNWESLFGGSAWQWEPKRKQFYYHKFYAQQPDLNWNNPAVEKAMFDGMRFWLDRGIAGFRLDAVPTLFESPDLKDEPERQGVNEQGDPNLDQIYTSNLSPVHGVIRRMRSMIDEYPGSRVLIGETYLPNTAELDKWYGGEKHDELQLPMDMIVGFHAEAGKSKLDASYLRRCVTEAETETHGSQPLFVFNNHDNDRSHDRYGDGVHDEAIDKLIAMLLLTSRSTALMYYGEELGMVTTKPTRVEDVKDPIGVTGWPKEKGRDGERTPMQWDASNAAGFSKNVKTWLPVPPSYKTLNVSAEEQSPDSLLNWYKQLIAMRRSMPALHDGGVVMLDTDNPSVLSYVRTSPAGGKAVLVSLNMSATEQTIHLVVPNRKSGQPVKTLLTKDAALQPAAETIDVVLQPYGSWSGELQ